MFERLINMKDSVYLSDGIFFMLKNIKKIINKNFVLLRINITFVVADSTLG
jgi:hypothetical protein